MVVGTVAFAGAASAAPGDVIYQANAGGGFTADGQTWDGLQTYLVAGGGSTSNHGQPSAIDDSVPAGTPTQIWDTERWDPADGDEMQYEFDVPSGQQVEVRLFFYDGYSGTSSVGDRVFDISVEDQTVENFDPIEEYGDDTGGMETFTVTSDGTIDVDFGHVTENPQVNAIQIVESGPQPDTLGGPDSVDFGTVVTGDTATETVTLTNLGGDGDPSIDVTDVSVTGTDAGEFSHDFSGSTTLAPGDSTDVQVTFSPSDAQAKAATLEVTHSGSNSPLTVDLSGEGASEVPVGFSKSKLQGFSAGNPTAIDFGPDGRAYVSTQGGTVYALDIERTGEDSYEVVNEVQIDAIKDIPNHDDFGNIESGEDNRQITGLTVGGTADQPVVYVGSSDPEIDVGQDDDDTDTNSGAISRLTINPGSDGTLQASEVDHDVMVLGLPRSEENHATNGLDLTPDGDTLYVAQGGHTNKGAPGDNFGHTPEYALSAAVLEIDLAQIENNHQAKSLQSYDSNYPDLDFYYGIPTIQNDDSTGGDDLPFGGNDGINQAKLIEGGPVQIYSPGYRNPYDLVLAESGQLYVSDHGPNGGWGGQPADANGNIVADAASVTNHPNEDGSSGTNDQLIAADESEYGGHAAPIRANPTQADIYDESGNVKFDITESNSPVPSSMVNPVEADYIPPTSQSPDPGAPAGSANTLETTSGQKVLFGPTGGTTEYTASNFGGAMEGDILQVELGGDIERVELSADGQTATNVETLFNTGGPLGIAAQDDDEVFPGTVWTANHGGNDITVFEPNDFDGTGNGDECTGADDPSLDEDGDGYDNADEIDAGTDPCSSSSTPADFDGDGTSNLNDPDDDNDGATDDVDPFAVDPDNGTTTNLPVQHDLSELSLFGDNGQGWTGLMTNGQDDYQDLYDPTKMTVGGAAEVLTVEEVPQGDAYAGTNTQQYAFQFGVNPPDEPFVVESTVASFPENPEDFQSAGIYVGTGDQSNYAKLVVAADGGNGGIEFAQEDGDSFTHQTSPNVVSDSTVTGSDTTLRLTVDPTTDPLPDNGEDEVALTAEYEVGGTTTEVGTAAIPASWLDTTDGSGLAVGVISTSNGASSTFAATWTDISVQTVATGDMTVAEAVASYDDGDDTINLNEIQTAINWWATGSEVPNTGGETISLQQMQELINIWATGATVGDGGGSNTAPTIDVIDDQTVTEGETAQVPVSASDADGDSLTLSKTSGPAFVTLTDNGDGTGTLDITPQSGDAGTYTVEVTADDGTTTATESFQLTVEEATTGGTLVAAVNAGGSDYTASDGTTYVADTSFSGSFSGSAGTSSTDLEIANTEDDPLYQTERYGDPLAYSLPVADGTYEITLKFAEIYHTSQTGGTGDDDGGGDGEVGDRVFDVSIEGQQVLTDYDIYDDAGELTATDKTFTVEVTDGTLNIEMPASTDYAKLSAFRIVDVSDGGSTGTASADVAVTESSGIDSSTYSGGSFEVTNTGDQQISSVQFDVSESLVPDAVFDPDGTAGDQTAKQLSIDSESGDGVGVVSTADGDVFSQPHNGVDNAEGYDVMTVAFTDFDPGESVSFSIDLDPTTIKGASTTGGAGSVSGLEIAGSDVTVEYADASTQVTDLFGDGSDGGSQATTDANVPGAPTLGVQGITLQSTDFPAHEAATVGETSQTLALSGPADATVQLIHVEASEPPSDGYDVDAFEADNAQSVSYQTVTLDSNGQGTASVTLSESNLNYFVAAVEGSDGDTGQASNTVILEVETSTNTAPSIDTISDQTVVSGETVTVPVSASDTDGDTLTLSKSSGPSFVTLTDNGDGTGSLEIAPGSADAGTYTVEVTADDGTATSTESFQLTVETATSTTAGTVAHRVNVGGSTIGAADTDPDWTGVTGTTSQYLVSASGGNYNGGDNVTAGSEVPSSTPAGVYDAERYGTMTWEFDVTAGSEVEVRLYLSNQFPETSSDGDRQYNVAIGGQQVLTQYDPVQDVGHATGTVKAFTVTDDGDGTVTITFEEGAIENPQVNAIEIVEASS